MAGEAEWQSEMIDAFNPSRGNELHSGCACKWKRQTEDLKKLFKELVKRRCYSGSDESYQTDEEFSDESVTDSIKRLNHISIEKSHRCSNSKKNFKTHVRTVNVSLRKVKRSRHFKSKTDARKTVKRKSIKKPSGERKKYFESPEEAPKNGKRCRVGGKAKGKPPEEEHHEKSDSDDDNDSYYFSRISLGYFQKFRDNSGASTSYEWKDECPNPFSYDRQETCDEPNEEMELLELQRWGVTNLMQNRTSEVMDKGEKIHPDSL